MIPERGIIMTKRTHEFKLSNVEESIKKHPKMWIGLSFISTFFFVADVVNTLKKERIIRMKRLSVVLVDGFNISLDLSKGIPVQIEVPDDYEVKEGEDAFFNENIVFIL